MLSVTKLCVNFCWVTLRTLHFSSHLNKPILVYCVDLAVLVPNVDKYSLVMECSPLMQDLAAHDAWLIDEMINKSPQNVRH